MTNYPIKDGDTVIHATINNGAEMPVVDSVENGKALCQLSDGSTQLIPVEALRVTKRTGGGFVKEGESWDAIKDQPE